eukprot:NODE_7164_length_804_cov_23.284875_g6558_i0.p1 GENE.NODE_7164_length_804_cov_23.284875_g6558_i0~~NODE_7164_length_804_cov_23.284875_g6558_i0.p1  ORF type:complete len:205 (-),score=38.10 NODE_7164_length_804_cov_23.284875_g6558_i0:137-751(-)
MSAADRPPPSVGTETRALFDFEARHNEQISFKKGDIITIVSEQTRSGWWNGSANGNTGFFPCNYVEILKKPEALAPGDNPIVGQKRVAIYSYTAVDKEQFSFRSGQTIEVTSTTDRNGWWKGKIIGDEGEGFFPAMYTKQTKETKDEEKAPNGNVPVPDGRDRSVSADRESSIAKSEKKSRERSKKKKKKKKKKGKRKKEKEKK